VQVPELAKLERFPQVQHLVFDIEDAAPDVTHFATLASCFPGGSITGAPKFRAMEIIDELEPLARGPYCGCHGYLGFNRESQLRSASDGDFRRADTAYFHAARYRGRLLREAEYEDNSRTGVDFFAGHFAPKESHNPSQRPKLF